MEGLVRMPAHRIGEGQNAGEGTPAGTQNPPAGPNAMRWTTIQHLSMGQSRYKDIGFGPCGPFCSAALRCGAMGYI
jgi:hypothetical protein